MDNSAANKKVMVAMSGGVDSSVAAYLLKKAGYDVIGATLRLWVDPSAELEAGEEAKGCCSYDAVLDARMVSAKLDISHYVFDMKKDFYESIVCNFVSEYLQGRTPSPCIECNRIIKFSVLRKKALGMGIDYIATGHYARIDFDSQNNRFKLLKGLDQQKDQSYMLYILRQKDLASILFPLGELIKTEVRKIAAELKLPVAGKDESQEICFIPDNDYRSFLSRHSTEVIQPGKIISTDGHVLGRHRGIANYTVGQRKGLGLSASVPHYVIRIDADSNSVIVGPENELYSRGLLAEKINFISGEPPREPLDIEVKIRYRASAVKAVLYPPGGDCCRVIFADKQKAVSPGQSAVFYRGEEVIGGGIIKDKIADGTV